MGSSYSCFAAKRRGIEKNKLPRKNVFVWKIDGFTSLLEEGEGPTCTSFKMLDMIWTLSANPMDMKIGATDSEKRVSLDLGAQGLCPNYMLETKVKIFIYSRYGNHIEHEVSHMYMTTSRGSKVHMIPLETLKNPSLGFLIGDSIAFGVEFIKLKKVPCNGVETISLIHKKKSGRSSSWYIEDFSQLSRPNAFSNPFKIGGYTWRLRLDTENVSYKNYIGLGLKLEDKSGSQLPPLSGVMVDAVLSIKRQSREVLANDPYQKTFRCNFSTLTEKSTTWGYPQFIRLDDFKNPSNGYLIKGTCTIEASVRIIGYGNDRLSD